MRFPPLNVPWEETPAIVRESSKEEQEHSLFLTSPTLVKTAQIWHQRTPAGKVLDKSPSCLCCGNQTHQVLGLTDHLKRYHGRILFQCAKCGKIIRKHHSVICHFPQCKGVAKMALIGEWTCEVSRKSFFLKKIGVGQHKKLVQLVVIKSLLVLIRVLFPQILFLY